MVPTVSCNKMKLRLTLKTYHIWLFCWCHTCAFLWIATKVLREVFHLRQIVHRIKMMCRMQKTTLGQRSRSQVTFSSKSLSDCTKSIPHRNYAVVDQIVIEFGMVFCHIKMCYVQNSWHWVKGQGQRKLFGWGLKGLGTRGHKCFTNIYCFLF